MGPPLPQKDHGRRTMEGSQKDPPPPRRITEGGPWKEPPEGSQKEDHRRIMEGPSSPLKEHLGRTAAGRTWEWRPGYPPPPPPLEEPQLASERFALEKRLSCYFSFFFFFFFFYISFLSLFFFPRKDKTCCRAIDLFNHETKYRCCVQSSMAFKEIKYMSLSFSPQNQVLRWPQEKWQNVGI